VVAESRCGLVKVVVGFALFGPGEVDSGEKDRNDNGGGLGTELGTET